MKKIALNPTDLGTINKYLVGGAAVGGGAALVTSLMNYINTLKDEAAGKNVHDDNTLVVNLADPNRKKQPVAAPAVKMAAAQEQPSLLRGGIALAGGALSGVGAYQLVRHMYQTMKKNRLESDLGNSQQMYLRLLDDEAGAADGRNKARRRTFIPGIQSSDEANKQASAAPGKPMGTAESIASLPVAATLLMSLASAVVANQALRKNFPYQTKPSRLTPRRVVVRHTDPVDAGEDEEFSPPPDTSLIPEKQAAFNDALEYLVDFVRHTESSGSEIADVVKAAAVGRYEDMIYTMRAYGTDAMFSGVKGEALTKAASTLDHLGEQLAVGLVVKSAALGPVIGVLAAAEFADINPGMLKFAAALPENVQTGLIDVLAGFRRVQRCDIFEGSVTTCFTSDPSVKEAHMIPGKVPQFDFAKLLAQSLATDGTPGPGQEGNEGSSLDSDPSQNSDGRKKEGDAPDGESKDQIDLLLGDGRSGRRNPYTSMIPHEQQDQKTGGSF